MSSITDSIIIVDSFTETLEIKLTEVLPWDIKRKQRFNLIDMSSSGGTGSFTTRIFAAAFNYLNYDLLKKWFEELPWDDTDHAILYYKHKYSDYPTIIRVCDIVITIVRGNF